MTTKEYLAQVARAEALKCWHGAVMGLKSNIQPIIEPWAGNKWTLKEADGLWCAAFVQLLYALGTSKPLKNNGTQVYKARERAGLLRSCRCGDPGVDSTFRVERSQQNGFT